MNATNLAFQDPSRHAHDRRRPRLALFDLESVGPDRYVGHSPPNGWSRVFGGQVIAQALIRRWPCTVEGRAPHSAPRLFRPGRRSARGRSSFPKVERIRDGRSFTTRRVLARQRGEAIFALSASPFKSRKRVSNTSSRCPTRPDPKLGRSCPATPPLAGKGRTTAGEGLLRSHVRPIELRPLDLRRYQPAQPGQKREPRQSIWIRIAGRLPDDPAIHRPAALAYLSDMTLLDTVLVAHGYSISSPEEFSRWRASTACALAAPAPFPRR